MTDRLDTQFRTLLEKKKVYDEKRKAKESAEKDYRDYEAELWEALETQHGKVKSFTVDLGELGNVRLTRTEARYSRVNDQDALVDWAKLHGREEELLTPGVRKRVLSELIRECLDQGIDLPDGADFYSTRRISVTKIRRR